MKWQSLYSRAQFSCSVSSGSLQPHGLQHSRLPRPSPTPGACSNSCPSSWWSIQWSHPPSPPSPPESVLCIRWTKYWSFSISAFNEYSGLISSRTDWLELAGQGTLKSLLQHHSSKASILQGSAFFIVPLSHPYMTTGKTRALTRRTSVGKVLLLLFDMLSRLVTAFLIRSKHFLISWLQAPSAVILEPQK